MGNDLTFDHFGGTFCLCFQIHNSSDFVEIVIMDACGPLPKEGLFDFYLGLRYILSIPPM